MTANETKFKIIKTASKLFAEKGYEGTSVRDIAKEADVNIASINYYFKNKLNLYTDLMEMNCKWFEKGVADLIQPGINTKDFIWHLHLYMNDNNHILMNMFKVMLGGNIPLPKGYINESEFCEIGPPGGEALFQVMKKDLGENANEDAIRWGVSTLFANTIHMSLVMSNTWVKNSIEKDPVLNSKRTRRNIEHHVDSVMNHIKTSGDDF